MELLKQQIQALIFCSEQSISLDEIAASLKLSFDWDVADEEILAAIEEIKQQFSTDDFSFELVEISEGFQFLTKKQYFPAVSALIQHKAKKKLSVSQMETLAIIAYRQPISKAETEHIRGVSCDYAIQKLLEKELIEISGKSDGPGRPILYSTSTSFMDYFGIKSVKDLPQLKDLHVEQNEIGTPVDTMTDGDAPDDMRELTVEEVIENSIVPEMAESENEIILSDSETNIFGSESESILEDEAKSIDDFEGERLVDQEEDLSIPDRKSIYLESEARETEAEEENNSQEETDSDNFQG